MAASDPIAAAHQRYLAGDGPSALDGLLDLWRKRGQPAIADLIDAVSAPVATDHGAPVSGKTRKQLQESWFVIEPRRRAVDLPGLVEVIPRMSARVARDMLTALLGWPRDPRLTGPLLELAKAPPRGYQGAVSGGFWQRHGTLLGRTADSRALGLIAKIISECDHGGGFAAIDGFMSRGLERAKSSIEKRVEAGKVGGELELELASSHARFMRAVSKAPVDMATIDALYAAVYEQPAEIELPVVLADALLEAGDPRGEFIALQCRPLLGEPITAAQRRRASQLLREHEDSWLGPLKAVVLKSGRVFAGGFLTEARIDTNQERLAQTVVGCREWATVKKLHIGIWPISATDLVKHPIMRSLESVTGAGA